MTNTTFWVGGVLATVLFSAGGVSAQYSSCGRPIYKAPVVQSPVYQAPVAKEVIVKEIITPVATPVFVNQFVPSFAYQYVPPYQVQIPAAVPSYAAAAAPGAYGQPAHGQPMQQQQQQQPGNNDHIKQLARAILEEMSRQAGPDSGPPPVAGAPAPGGYPQATPPATTPPKTPGGYPQATPPSAPPAGQQPQHNTPGGFPPAAQPVVPHGGGGLGNGKPNPNSPLAAAAVNALSRNCAACHTGGASRGDTVLFNQPGILNSESPWKSVVREIEAGRMPPRQSNWRFTPEEYQIVTRWLNGE